MKVIIRVDASVAIGSGHVMRCLTIARQLQARGCSVKFWMLPLEGSLINYVQHEGFENITAAEHAELYIVDHYELDEEWELSIRPFTRKIVVIDDLANRKHACDLLLDQNVVPHFEARYDELVPAHCVKLLGPAYLIMRQEFLEARHCLRERSGQVRRLLVFMGGTDPTNETMKILQALEDVHFAHIDVVVGNGNVQKNRIRTICLERGYFYHQQIDYMATLMEEADFAIGAGGSTMWERCYVGLPSACTIVADNQRVTTAYAEQLGAIVNVGWHEQVTAKTYRELLSTLHTINLKEMSIIGLQITASNEPNAWISKMMELIR